jgi:hypothetical protein
VKGGAKGEAKGGPEGKSEEEPKGRTYAYLSHCPDRCPDFQQLIELSEVPQPYPTDSDSSKNKAELYEVSSTFLFTSL